MKTEIKTRQQHGRENVIFLVPEGTVGELSRGWLASYCLLIARKNMEEPIQDKGTIFLSAEF